VSAVSKTSVDLASQGPHTRFPNRIVFSNAFFSAFTELRPAWRSINPCVSIGHLVNNLLCRNFWLIACAALYGCSSVTMMDGSAGQATEGSCNVRVYQTHAQALKGGEIEELCVISGDTSLRFSHHSSEAIAKHKSKACACGADSVYVMSRMDGTIQMQGQATMVAFRYVKATSKKYEPATTTGDHLPALQPNRSDALKNVEPAVSKDTETSTVVQFLAENGFAVVGKPFRFKQQDNLNYYEARGPGGQITQVVCESGVCRLRTFYE
jgi:hypothetical protein